MDAGPKNFKCSTYHQIANMAFGPNFGDLRGFDLVVLFVEPSELGSRFCPGLARKVGETGDVAIKFPSLSGWPFRFICN